MQNYHIYEAIGRGKHSVVYKGRKKKSIQYYAVKSVEKSQRPRVLQEVRTLYTLDHGNILKFYAWYETQNHLWLVLEYCVGGDLLTLLRQDVKLPEDTVLGFARDLVEALSFLHSRGLIYCDLKPSNLLLDENGHLKLGDFGLTRRVTGGDNGSVANLPPAKRGTPAYMAPELFQEDGCHSVCSDLYALGCSLYECLAGRPPFVSSSFTELVNAVLWDAPPPLPSTLSPELNDLIMRLLAKDPPDRLNWEELLEHPFWGTPLSKELLPPEGGPGAIKRAKQVARQAAPAASVDGGQRSSINVVRLSQIVRNNMNTEAEGAAYRDGQQAESDVQLDSADAELNFGDTETADAAGDDTGAEAETDGEGTTDGEQDTDGSDVDEEGLGEKMSNLRVSLSAPHTPQEGGPTGNTALRHSQTAPRPGHTPIGLPAETPPGIGQQRGAAADALGAGMDASDALPLAELLHHQSDSAVKPIVLNRRIDKIYKSVASSASLNEKVNTLGYFETLCMDTAAANMLINSSLMLLFVRIMKSSKAPALRIRLANIIGLLVRHATYITDELARSGLVTVLAECLRDRNERLRRRAMAGLGELLFYVATQQEENAEASGLWDVPPSIVGLVTRLLKSGEDEITQHYAVKAIENIVTHGGDWASKFSSQDVAINIAQIYSTTRAEHLRATAASAVARVCRHSPGLIQGVVDRLGVKLMVSGLTDSSHKVTQPILNLLNLAIGEINARSRAALTEETSLLPALSSLLENGPSVVKAKAVLCVALLCKMQQRWLQQVCDSRMLLLVERLQKDKDPYVLQCCAAMQATVVGMVPAITDAISTDVEQLSSRKGARPTGTTARTPSGGTGAAGAPGKSQLVMLPVLLHLLTAAPFRGRVVDAALVASVSRLLAVAEGGGRGGTATSAEVRPQVLQIVEALSQHAPELVQQVDAVMAHLLPTLSKLLDTSMSGDCRFLCLKLLCDVMLLLMSEPGMYAPESEGAKDPASTTARINTLVKQHILPVCASLLDDEDPIPLYTLKLLVAVIEANPLLVADAARLDLVPRLFGFLSLEHTNNNVHNVRLCRLAVGAADVVPDRALMEHGVADKVAAVLAYAFDNAVEPFMEPVLDICRMLLHRTATSVRAGGSDEVTGAAVLLDYAPIFVEAAAAPELYTARVALDCLLLLREVYTDETAMALMTPHGIGAFFTAVEAFEEDTQAGSADTHLHCNTLELLTECCSAKSPAIGAQHKPSREDLKMLDEALRRLHGICSR
eukprot:gene4153-5131_t